MEQNLNDKPLSNMQIARYIESLRKEMNFDDEVYGLVKSDLEDGLTQEQTEKYLDKNFNIGQMRVLSEGLHKEIPEELFNILHNNKLSGNQMKVSLEFYEKGVAVETIQEAVARGEKPVVMRRLYEEVLAQLSKAAEQYTQDSEYVKELIAQMEMVVEKINYQEERYDALNKKLSDVEVLKEDKEVTERLVKENEDKDGIISHQQDELNKASGGAIMAEEIQEAVQIIRVAYDGIEIAMKVGSGGIAAMQKAIDFLKGMLDYEKSLGKTSMRKLLLKGGDLQVLQFKTEDMRKVERMAKKYGILYSVLHFIIYSPFKIIVVLCIILLYYLSMNFSTFRLCKNGISFTPMPPFLGYKIPAFLRYPTLS